MAKKIVIGLAAIAIVLALLVVFVLRGISVGPTGY